MVKIQELVIDAGIIDDTPPTYSPFHHSKADLYLYHGEYFKHGITSAACIASNNNDDDDDEDEDEVMMMTCGVWEMKNNRKVAKQLYANMLHIGYQMVVKALKLLM